MAVVTIKIRRGVEGSIPALADGEPGWCTDTFKLFVGQGGTNHQVGGGSSYTDEQAQDAVGGILVDSATIDFTYSDPTPSITADVKDDSISDAKLRNSGALSVIGRGPNSAGDPADIGGITVDGDHGDGVLVYNATTHALEWAQLDTTFVSGPAVLAFLGDSNGGPEFHHVSGEGLAFLALAMPGADRLVFWDDSAGVYAFLTVGAGLSLVGTTLSVDTAASLTWTALETFNRPAGSVAVLVTETALGGAGQADSPYFTWRGFSWDTGSHSVNWYSYADVTSNAGASTWRLASTVDSGTITTRFSVSDAGNGIFAGTVAASNFSGTSSGTNTGDQTVTLTGDVTGSGTGSFAATVANNAVTDAKFRQGGAHTLVGRSANSTGNVADISLGTDQLLVNRGGVLTAEDVGYRLIKQTVLSSGTGASFTFDSRTRVYTVEVVAGGGSGGSVTGAAGQHAGAGGGGSGGYALKLYLTVGTGTYTVGAGGAAPAAGANNGNAGSDSTWTDGTTLVTAKAGGGGQTMGTGTSLSISVGGTGGAVSTNGDVNGGGNAGEGSVRLSGTQALAGNGAPGPWGGAGTASPGAANGTAGQAPGAGGGGASSGTAVNRSGGAGAAGVIVVKEFA